MKQMELAQTIAALRKQRGVTQEQLAEAVGVSAQAVSKWETSVCLPDTQTLPLIAAYFQVSIDYLFYGENITYDDIYEKNFRKVSKHKLLGMTYRIEELYHSAVCLLLAVAAIQQQTLSGYSCCMGYGDFPIRFA